MKKILTLGILGVIGFGFTELEQYPIDGYERTGIKRLKRLEMVQNGELKETSLLPEGAKKSWEDIQLNLRSRKGDSVECFFAVDEAFQKDIGALFRGLDKSYSLTIMDISDPDHVRYAERNKTLGYQPGSVGKLAVLVALFEQLAKIYPDSFELRTELLRKKEVQLGEQLMAFVRSVSYEASRTLAGERGCFPNWENSIFYPDMPLRNASCNSIAPTGSISIIANTSYSIEPLYALAYRRVGVLGGKIQEVINPVVLDLLEQYGLLSDGLLKTIGKTGSVQTASWVPKDLRRLLLTSMEIPWKYHLRHQRAFQKYTDNAVAKTINLSKATPKGTISQIYRTAWEYGLKGITVYRDGSRADQVLQTCRLNGATTC